MQFLRYISMRFGQFVCWSVAAIMFIPSVMGINEGTGGGAGGVFAGCLITAAILRATMIWQESQRRANSN
jgi:hypothetical protein